MLRNYTNLNEISFATGNPMISGEKTFSLNKYYQDNLTS